MSIISSLPATFLTELLSDHQFLPAVRDRVEDEKAAVRRSSLAVLEQIAHVSPLSEAELLTFLQAASDTSLLVRKQAMSSITALLTSRDKVESVEVALCFFFDRLIPPCSHLGFAGRSCHDMDFGRVPSCH